MAAAVMGGSVNVTMADELQSPVSAQETESVSTESGGVVTEAAQRASEAVVVSIYPGNMNSRTESPAKDVYLYASALCTSSEIGTTRLCQWSARMWGSMSDAYTTAYYSFGYSGQVANQKVKTRFTINHKSYSDSAVKGSSCANVMTKLYY